MNRKSLSLTGFALLAGVVGMILRWLQLKNYDAETGLFRSGSVASALLIFVLTVSAVVLFVLALSLRRPASAAPGMELPPRRGFLPTLIACVACAVMLFGALMLFSAAYTRLNWILAVFGVLTAFAALFLFTGMMRRSRGGLGCFCGVVTVLFHCFWLIASYKEHAADPVVWAYGPEILAISAAVLAFYYLTGYPFGKAKPYWTAVFCALGVVFSLTTLPDSRGLGLRMMLIGTAAFLLVCLWQVSSGAFMAPIGPGAPEGPEGPGGPPPEGPGEPSGPERPEPPEKPE